MKKNMARLNPLKEPLNISTINLNIFHILGSKNVNKFRL